MTEQLPDVMTKSEVAKLLRVGRGTLIYWEKVGILRPDFYTSTRNDARYKRETVTKFMSSGGIKNGAKRNNKSTG